MQIFAGGTRAGILYLLVSSSYVLLKHLSCSLPGLQIDATFSCSLQHTRVLEYALTWELPWNKTGFPRC